MNNIVSTTRICICAFVIIGFASLPGYAENKGRYVPVRASDLAYSALPRADSSSYLPTNQARPGPARIFAGFQVSSDSLIKKFHDQFWDDVNKRRYQAAGFVSRVVVDLSLAGPGATPPQFSGQKSEAELARMTPEQHVQQYCDEYYHNAFWDHEYTNLLESYVLRDGMGAIPALIKIIDQFDPNDSKANSRKVNAWSYAAEGLLSQLDERCIRLRATDEGRRAIDTIERLAARLQAAADRGPKGNSYVDRSEMPRLLLRDMQGTNGVDGDIQDTLRIKFSVTLSDDELRGFVKYLIQNDPRYPGWAETELYSDPTVLNAAGKPSMRVIVKNHERIWRLYATYKAGTRP